MLYLSNLNPFFNYNIPFYFMNVFTLLLAHILVTCLSPQPHPYDHELYTVNNQINTLTTFCQNLLHTISVSSTYYSDKLQQRIDNAGCGSTRALIKSARNLKTFARDTCCTYIRIHKKKTPRNYSDDNDDGGDDGTIRSMYINVAITICNWYYNILYTYTVYIQRRIWAWFCVRRDAEHSHVSTTQYRARALANLLIIHAVQVAQTAHAYICTFIYTYDDETMKMTISRAPILNCFTLGSPFSVRFRMKKKTKKKKSFFSVGHFKCGKPFPCAHPSCTQQSLYCQKGRNYEIIKSHLLR